MNRIFNYIKNVRSEWFKITWPTRDAVIKSGILIIVFSAIAALFFFLTDSVLNALVGWIF
ncbi:MAG: preprotein translocase subunit SecE [Rickettsiales bacterium]|jgi:preprotein translocase subunit SecE|nr:preprotein translocase subunit SecE [Rickettsiales bacterium]